MNHNTIITSEKIIINGIELPPLPNNMKFTNATIINNKVYVNGYEFKNGKWKKTFKAWWHKVF